MIPAEHLLQMRSLLDAASRRDARLRNRPRGYFLRRRLIDLAVCVCVLPFCVLIGLPVAVLITAQDGGPVLFRQQRTGQNGQRFDLLKLRTMCVDAEARKSELQRFSTVAWPDFKMDADPRVTAIGRFLRRTHLDEMPQLINVLRGDMTLVGPRPTSFAPATYLSWHTERLDAKAGMTGLWQLRRSPTESSVDERLRLDIEYLRTRSTRVDLQILVATVWSRCIRGLGR